MHKRASLNNNASLQMKKSGRADAKSVRSFMRGGLHQSSFIISTAYMHMCLSV
jgi:hypothetical protein